MGDEQEPMPLAGALRERMERLASIPLRPRTEPESTPNSPEWIRPSPPGIQPDLSLEKIRPELWETLQRAVLHERLWPVFLYGGVGCGKSHAAASVYRKWQASKLRIGTVRWFRCDNLVDSILKARFSDGIVVWLPSGESVRMTEPGLFDSFASADFVVLDDMGTSEVRADRYASLLRLIDSRVGKPTIITSNLDPAGLEKVFDDRIASRLIAGTVLHATGGDRRLEESRFVEA